jgi:hypothetical protein
MALVYSLKNSVQFSKWNVIKEKKNNFNLQFPKNTSSLKTFIDKANSQINNQNIFCEIKSTANSRPFN